MRKPFGVVVRWMDGKSVICTTNLNQAVIKWLTQEKPIQGDPFESIEIYAETITFGEQAAAK